MVLDVAFCPLVTLAFLRAGLMEIDRSRKRCDRDLEYFGWLFGRWGTGLRDALKAIYGTPAYGGARPTEVTVATAIVSRTIRFGGAEAPSLAHTKTRLSRCVLVVTGFTSANPADQLCGQSSGRSPFRHSGRYTSRG